MKTIFSWRILPIIFSLLIVQGCGDIPLRVKVDPIDLGDKTIAVLDRAIGTLEGAPEQWEAVFQNSIEELSHELQSTIRNELTHSFEKGVQALTSNTLCVADAIGPRLLDDLTITREGFKSLRFDKPYTPSHIPVVCYVSPDVIDLQEPENTRRYLSFNGYDFQQLPGEFTAHLIERNTGNSYRLEGKLSINSRYKFTLALDELGQGLAPFRSVQVRYTDPFHSKLLSEVSILR